MKKTITTVLKKLNNTIDGISFEVRFWDGNKEIFGSGPPTFTLIFNRPEAARNVLAKGTMGFGEEYAAGNIDIEGDFRQLVRLGVDSRFQNMKLSAATRAAALIQHIASLNTIKRARKNIAHHYDLGNDFYKLYLDESMTYSCAYFKSTEDTLEQAQQQKYEHICRKLRLQEGESLIDVGCGWGGMLLYAARNYGIKGLGCTISPKQAQYAQKKVAEAGLAGKITILCDDYRNISGQFDKYISIGMFEHVGKGYISAFMDKTRALLKPGGTGLLHTIGKERPTGEDPWTMKYIFPGGHIPVLDHTLREMGKKGLVPLDVENLRLHYAATLDEWGKRFENNLKEIAKSFDNRFVRTWRIFLWGSSAAFRWGEMRLYQILFTNGLNNSLPLTRDHLYQP